MDDDLIGKTVKCPDCGDMALVIPLDNSFDYAGTHCTYGRAGTHYPADYGLPVTECCEAPVYGLEEEDDEQSFDGVN